MVPVTISDCKDKTTKPPHLPDFGSLLLDAQNNNCTALNTPELIHSIAYPNTEPVINLTADTDEVDFSAALFMEKTSNVAGGGECDLDELSLYEGFSLEPLKKEAAEDKAEEEVVKSAAAFAAVQGMKPEDPNLLLTSSSAASEVVRRPSSLSPHFFSSLASPALPIPHPHRTQPV